MGCAQAVRSTCGRGRRGQCEVVRGARWRVLPASHARPRVFVDMFGERCPSSCLSGLECLCQVEMQEPVKRLRAACYLGVRRETEIGNENVKTTKKNVVPCRVSIDNFLAKLRRHEAARCAATRWRAARMCGDVAGAPRPRSPLVSKSHEEEPNRLVK